MIRLYRNLILALALSAGAAASEARLPEPIRVDDDGVEIRYRTAAELERKSASEAISAQLKAFREDNYELAASFQSRDLQRNFRSADDFRTVIRRTYPHFAHSKSAAFGHAVCTDDGRRLLILVSLETTDGITARAIYEMVREGELYRVAGVQAWGSRRPAPQDIL